METIQTFVLGAASALALIGLGYSFVSVLRINKTVKQLNERSKEVDIEFGETHRSIDERFDQLEKSLRDRMDNMCEDFKHINDEVRRIIDELYSYTDSRFDKQADKASAVIANTNRTAFDAHDQINKLRELFHYQMEQFAKVTLDHSERLAELETDQKVTEDKIEQINS